MRERDLVATARSLALDRTAAEVVAALRAGGVDAILLKGPVFARWLYADGAARPYDDVDLLVAPRDLRRAYRVLEGLGFDGLVRGDDVVDLADALNGAGLEPAAAWALLRGRARTMRIGGVEAPVLDPAARALHCALHAWWHGPAADRPAGDLERALAVASEQEWREAGVLARRLAADDGFERGLAAIEPGRRLLARLGRPLPPPYAPTVPLADADPAVRRIDALRRAVGWRARAHVAWRAVAPPAGELRAHHLGARRGRTGLAAAYAHRAASGIAALPELAGNRRSVTTLSGEE